MSRVDAKTNSLTKGLTQNLFKIPFTRDKSIKFDGTDDQVLLPVALPSTFSVSFWFKQTDEVNGEYLFDSRNSGSDAWAAWTTGTSSHTISVWNGATHTGSIQVPSGTWAHVVITVDGQYLNLYVNGEHDGAKAGYGGTTTSDIKVGTRYTGGNAWQGSQDEWAIFSTALTARQVSDLYNNGQPTNLSSYSTLAAWYRMGEGKLGSKSDGESNLLFDQGPNGGLGSELIKADGDMYPGGFFNYTGNIQSYPNGTAAKFARPSSGGSQNGGFFRLNSAAGGGATQNLVIGRSYELSFDFLTDDSDSYPRLYQPTTGYYEFPAGSGRKSYCFTAEGTDTQFVNANILDNGKFVQFSGITLKEISNSGTINGPAIQADGGTELVTNGTFDTDVSGWSAAGNGALSYQNGVLRVTTSGGVGSANQVIALSSGATFTLTFDVVAETQSSGIPFFQVTSGLTNTGITSTGTHTIVATASSNNPTLTFSLGGAATNGEYIEIDNISVKEQTESVPKKVQNLRPIAPGERSLSFDGTDDLVDLGASSTFFSTNVNSISMWFKMPDTSGGAERIFVSNSDAGGSDLRVVVSTSGIISVDIWNGSSLVSTTGGSAIDDDIWHHLAYTTNASAQALYIDGVSVATTTHTRSSRAGSVSATIASHVTSGIYSDVDVDEVAIWDTVLDGDAVKAIYNAGQPTHLFVNTGAYDIYRDNLKAYYKMGDATNPAQDGTSNLLFDQTSPGLGSTQGTNVDFETGDLTGWTVSNSNAQTCEVTKNSAGSNALHIVSDGAFVSCSQNFPNVAGKVYKLEYDLEVISGSVTIHAIANRNSSGTYTNYITATGSTQTIQFKRTAGGAAEFFVDNVSFREVNGNTGTISGATIQTDAPKQIYALPPVANTKSLNFDGTNDHLVTQVDSVAQPNNESRYYSFWCKTSDTASDARPTIFSHGGASTGAFYFNFASSRPILFMANTVYQYWVDNPAQDDGEWHHWTVKIKYNDITGCELWCDGVKQVKSDVFNSGSMNTYTSGITLGSIAGASRFLEGSLDEFSIHEDLDTESIRALFNRGRPIDISRSQGAYDLSDKALHWWRMGDATSPAADGTNDIIFQGLEAEDSELITGFTNGSTYSFDTLVTSGRDITSAIETSGNWGGAASNTISIVAGQTYKVTFNLSYNSGSDTLRVALVDTASGAATLRSNIYYTNTNGVNVAYLTATATDTSAHLQLGTWHSTDLINFSATDISVKQVRGQYIGGELVKPDADLYTTGRWTVYGDNVGSFPGGTAARFDRLAGSSSHSAGGVINLTSGSGTNALTADMETNCVYKLQFDFETNDSDANPRYYNGSSYTDMSAGSGIKTLYIVANGASGTAINADKLTADRFVQFSNLSVTKIGGAAVMTNMTTSDIQTDTPY